ncbi:MAG: carbonic anhydrase [Rhodospirillales bacterium]
MCEVCERKLEGRRRFLSLAGLGLASAGIALLGGGRAIAAPSAGAGVGPAEALARLKAGNARYVSSGELCVAELASQRASVAAVQTPWATIVSCADSRLPPELVYGGLGHGELFVARNAGNMVDTATKGTVEYGSAVLGVQLVVVLGHRNCGAVKAACDIVSKGASYPGAIEPMVQAIVPAARAVKGQPGDFVDNAVRESTRRTATQLATRSTILAGLIKEKKLMVVAAIYDLESGKIEYIA